MLYLHKRLYLYRYIYNNQGLGRHGAPNAGDDFGSGLSERSSQEWTTGHCRLILQWFSWSVFSRGLTAVGWTMSITIYLLVYCLQYTAIAKYELQSSGLSGYEVPLCCDH